MRDLDAIKRTIEEFQGNLNQNPTNIEELKSLLNKIAQIKTMSMMMEFKIADVVEKFRTLLIYQQPVEQALLDEVFSLEAKW